MWKTVAEGTNITNLQQVVEDMYLPKGAQVKVVMDTWAPWAFDVAGAEWAFKPFVPDGLELIDVYGQRNSGIVEMEADPAWLVAVLVFIKAHWLAVTIAGLALYTIISFIRVMVQLPSAAQIPVWLILGAAAGIIGLAVISARGQRRVPT